MAERSTTRSSGDRGPGTSAAPGVTEWAETSDRVLVGAAALGETDAFEEIVSRYGPEMFRYARNMLSDQGAAEEVVQDAFVAAWKGLDNFRGDSALRTWLFSMVSHKVIDHRRKRSVAPAEDWVFERRSTGVGSDPEADVRAGSFMEELGSALAELPYRQRACWLLREVEGMTHPEIGEIMHLSAGAVRGQVVRARGTLSERLASWRTN